MKSLFMLIYTLVAITLTFLAASAHKRKEGRYTEKLTNVLIWAMIAVLAQGVIVSATNAVMAEIGFSLFFISIDWILVNLLYLICTFTSYEMRYKRIAQIVLRTYLFVDTMFFLTNYFTRLEFNIERVTRENQIYFKAFHQNLYTAHLIACYIISALIAFLLIWKIAHVTYLYWDRYIMMLVAFLSVILWDAAYVFLGDIIDYSVMGYAMAGILVYYNIMIYKPKLLIDHMLSNIVNIGRSAVIFFDADDDCVYVNEKAKDLFEIEDNDYGDCGDKIEHILGDTTIDRSLDYYDVICNTMLRGISFHLDVEYHLIEKSGKKLGYFFSIEDRTADIDALNREHYLASHDGLTGLFNRDYFYSKVKEVLDHDPQGEYYLVAADVKDFKLINDVFGTRVGDNVLMAIATAVKEHKHRDTIASRLTGDKFCAFARREHFSESTLLQGADAISKIKGVSYPLVLRFGIYYIEDRSLSISSMIDRAFMTISYNRAEFKNRIYYYDNRIREERLFEKKLSGELTEAIVNENIKLYLQPQCTADGSVKGAEALVRWDHPEDGLLLPGRFVPLFERNGLIPVLDRYIWECAAKLLRKWKNEGLLNYYISVNISPTDFFFLDVYDEFHRLIKKYDIDPANLRLEITESIMINDIKRKLTVLEELHKEGFIIEMDDFGSGYSSLNMLKDLPVDAIKIDMGFLYNAGDMDKSKKILRMVVELAKELKMPVICEGVESEFQVEFLNGIGCDYYQGYYFSRPVPIDKFEQHMIQGG